MLDKLKFGGYPAGYDFAKHGPYDPARYYGKGESVRCICTLVYTSTFNSVEVDGNLM